MIIRLIVAVALLIKLIIHLRIPSRVKKCYFFQVTEIVKSIDEYVEKLQRETHESCSSLNAATPEETDNAVFTENANEDEVNIEIAVTDCKKQTDSLSSEQFCLELNEALPEFSPPVDGAQMLAVTPCEGESPLVSREYNSDAGGLLSRLSGVEFSSTSSLASFDLLEDNTLSSYSYNGSRDNLDGFTYGDELCFGDGTTERLASLPEGKGTQEYKELVDHLEDKIKFLEREKDREMQALHREIQGLKLELAKYSARENITIVKNRLEMEGKNQLIVELRDEVEYLQSSINDLSLNKDSEESRQDYLQREVNRRSRRINCLEDEKKSLEERLSLAEDLQKNDRDLLDVLRNQLTTLESDLLASEDAKKQLEREIRELKSVENEVKEVKENSQRMRKHIEFLSAKLKLREQHVSYLEDDNVRMHQEKTEVEGKLQKNQMKVDRLNELVKDLRKEIQSYLDEVKHLSEENSQLEQAHWQVMLNQSDASGQLEDYIKDLEKRVGQGDAKIRDLDSENESLVSQSREMLENLVSLQNEADESKRQLDLATDSYSRLQTTKTDQDKRMITLQRRLKKLQKEKKRFQIERQESDEKIQALKVNEEKLSTKCDDIEKGYKMLQLKLQSTEAKLTMVGRNKIYMESKLNDYEKKYESNKQILSRVDHLLHEYLRKFDGKELTAQKNWDLESVEVMICRLIEISASSVAELSASQARNSELVNAIRSGHLEIDALCNELRTAKKEMLILKCSMDDRLHNFARFQDYFTNNVAYLAQQNDLLEGRLEEVKGLKSVIEHHEGRLNGSRVSSNSSSDCDVMDQAVPISNGRYGSDLTRGAESSIDVVETSSFKRGSTDDGRRIYGNAEISKSDEEIAIEMSSMDAMKSYEGRLRTLQSESRGVAHHLIRDSDWKVPCSVMAVDRGLEENEELNEGEMFEESSEVVRQGEDVPIEVLADSSAKEGFSFTVEKVDMMSDKVFENEDSVLHVNEGPSIGVADREELKQRSFVDSEICLVSSDGVQTAICNEVSEDLIRLKLKKELFLDGKDTNKSSLYKEDIKVSLPGEIEPQKMPQCENDIEESRACEKDIVDLPHCEKYIEKLPRRENHIEESRTCERDNGYSPPDVKDIKEPFLCEKIIEDSSCEKDIKESRICEKDFEGSPQCEEDIEKSHSDKKNIEGLSAFGKKNDIKESHPFRGIYTSLEFCANGVLNANEFNCTGNDMRSEASRSFLPEDDQSRWGKEKRKDEENRTNALEEGGYNAGVLPTAENDGTLLQDTEDFDESSQISEVRKCSSNLFIEGSNFSRFFALLKALLCTFYTLEI